MRMEKEELLWNVSDIVLLVLKWFYSLSVDVLKSFSKSYLSHLRISTIPLARANAAEVIHIHHYILLSLHISSLMRLFGIFRSS